MQMAELNRDIRIVHRFIVIATRSKASLFLTSDFSPPGHAIAPSFANVPQSGSGLE